MTSLQAALDEESRQLTLEELLQEIEAEENSIRGDCPHVATCRRHHWSALPQYQRRPASYLCHWIIWGDWHLCKLYGELEGNGHE